MKNLIASLLFLFIGSVAGMADLHGAPQDPHNPHDPTNLHNPARQAHQQAMEQHQKTMQQHMDQHMRDHNAAMEMHQKVHEEAVKKACCLSNNPTCAHQCNEVRREKRGTSLVERIRAWRENRRSKEE